MTIARWCALLGCLTIIPAAAAAQEFQPPGGGSSSSSSSGTSSGTANGVQFGILGFSTRAGAQVNHGAQAIVGSTIDVAQLWSPQVRLRPSFEVGFGKAGKSLHAALEVIYRFQPDNATAIPYVGAGVGYYDAGADSTAGGTQVWPTLVMGFELPFKPTFNWLIEYHALDRLGRHRFLIGLASRAVPGQ